MHKGRAVIDGMQSSGSEPPLRPTIPGVLGYASVDVTATPRPPFGPPALPKSAHHVDTAPLAAPPEPARLGPRRPDHGGGRVRRGRGRPRVPVRAPPPQHQRPREPVRPLPRPPVGPPARAGAGRAAAQLAVRLRHELPARFRHLPLEPVRGARRPVPARGHRPRRVRGHRAEDGRRRGGDGLAAAYAAPRALVGGGAAGGLVRAVRLVGDRGLVQPDVAGRADRVPTPVSDG